MQEFITVGDISEVDWQQYHNSWHLRDTEIVCHSIRAVTC